jgi:hypothetical protein
MSVVWWIIRLVFLPVNLVWYPYWRVSRRLRRERQPERITYVWSWRMIGPVRVLVHSSQEKWEDWGLRREVIAAVEGLLSLPCREWLYEAFESPPRRPGELRVQHPEHADWVYLGSASDAQTRRFWREMRRHRLLKDATLAQHRQRYYWTIPESIEVVRTHLRMRDDLCDAVLRKTVFRPYADETIALWIIQSIGDLHWAWKQSSGASSVYRIIRWAKPQNRSDAGWTGEEPRDVLTLRVRRSVLAWLAGWKGGYHRQRETAVACAGHTAEGAALDRQECGPEEAEALVTAFGFSPQPLRETARLDGWYDTDLDYALLPLVGGRNHGNLRLFVDIAPGRIDDLRAALPGDPFVCWEAFRTPEGYWEVVVEAPVQEIPRLQESVAPVGGRIVHAPSNEFESITGAVPGTAAGKGVEISVLDACWW